MKTRIIVAASLIAGGAAAMCTAIFLLRLFDLFSSKKWKTWKARLARLRGKKKEA